MEEKLKLLIEDLKKVNKEFNEFTLKKEKVWKKFLNSKTDDNEYKKVLTDRASIIVNFYENVFVPKYSEINDHTIKEVGNFLSNYNFKTKEYLNEKNYFALSVLFIDKGDKFKEPNNLEKLIKSLE